MKYHLITYGWPLEFDRIDLELDEEAATTLRQVIKIMVLVAFAAAETDMWRQELQPTQLFGNSE
jgi:hypothetical protein